VAKLVFGMNQSLDGFVDHDAFAPAPDLFRHFIEQTRDLAGSLYGRKLYQIMSYWDEEQPGWGPDEQAFAEAWRRVPKYVVSRSLTEVGPNATLLGPDLEAEVSRLKAEVDGDIEVGGPDLATTLTALGLIDEYRIYLHPAVVGSGTTFFKDSRPALRLQSHERIGDALKLIYVPAALPSTAQTSSTGA
jgi:dihydrofolate reductase